MAKIKEVDFTDRFYSAIESIWERDRSEITYRILDLEKNPDYDNPMDITEIDIGDEGYDWNVKINNGTKWQSMKIGKILRSFFGMDTFNHSQTNEFIRKYHRATGFSDNGQKIETTTGPSSIGFDKQTKSANKGTTTKYSGGTTTRYSGYDEYDDWSGYGYGGYGGYKPSEKDVLNKYGYSGYGYQSQRNLGTKIDVPPFKYDPKNVYNTFLWLTTKTYPHFAGNPHEKEVLKFLPKLDEDKYGNYFKIIGESDTMFTCHLDTADREQKNVSHYSYKEGEDTIIQTDGTSILGADDKSGVCVLLYMMAHNVPGVYYFFIGEERGGIGSRALANNWEENTHLHHINKCVSFDRKRYSSVITAQGGVTCCSNEFATDLAKKLSTNGLSYTTDGTGVWTDSMAFVNLIGECTNISVGYFNEHTSNEIQNISHLERLSKACVEVNWKEVVVRRNLGFNSEVLKKYKGFITDMKSSTLACSTKLVGDDKNIYFRIEFDEPISEIHNDLLTIQDIMKNHKIDPDIIFEDEYLKIELN